MFKIIFSLAIWALILLLPGCAFTIATPVEPGDRETRGFRIYDPKPVLLVMSTGTSIEYIPNYSKPYAVRFEAFLAKNHSTMKVSNGILTEVDADLDSTDIIELLQDLAKQLTPGGGPSEAAAPGEFIAVYDFVFDDDGNLVALRELPNTALPHGILKRRHG